MNTTTETLAVEVRHTYPVSRERLFQAWTDPQEARLWFGGDGCRPRSLEMDVRPGGRFVMTVDGCEGGLWTVTGEYREVTPPSKLVYTWRWEDDPQWEGVDSVITVEFLECAGGAEVRLLHERFPSAESQANHQRGWTASLEKLAKILNA
jgi:uncharacterized protein YndB with AHSA1/START domain